MEKISLIIFLFCIGSINANAQYSAQDQANAANYQFQSGLDKVKDCMATLQNQVLINKINYEKLEDFKQKLNKEWPALANKYYDMNNPNTVDMYCNRINEYLKDRSISYEVNLVGSMSMEIYNIKSKDSENFSLSTRYKELMSVYDELQNCSPDDIRTIAIKHGLLR